MFEKTDRIGGRTLTVPVYNDATQPIELGASIFVKINQIMYNSSQLFGLPTSEPHKLENGDVTAIWNGKEFVFETSEGTWWVWDTAKLFWKYGLAPYRAIKLVNGAVGLFTKLYEPPYFPFPSLTKRVVELGLAEITGATGEQVLAKNNVSFSNRRREIHGLTSMHRLTPDSLVISGRLLHESTMLLIWHISMAWRPW